MFHLDDTVAIVTGAHAWLGYDIACTLAEAGSNIVVTSRELSRAQETAVKIHDQFGVDTLGLEMDQRRFDAVQAMVAAAHAWRGHIDVLVNNAGGGVGKSEGQLFKRRPEEEIDLISTNLIGVLFCCKEVARVMVKQGHGKIINIASAAGLIGRDRRLYQRSQMKGQPVDYAAAKGGVIALTRDLAGFLSPNGVHVNSISPGGFDKGDLPKMFTQELADRVMLGRWGRMGTDIKGAALFLASRASDYVTGHNLVVDGGFSIWK